MRDPAIVRQRQRVRDRLEELHRVHQRARREPVGALLLEELLERHALQPLEDHERQLAFGRGQHADVARLADGGAPLRELGQDGALPVEVLQELGVLVRRDLAVKT